MRHQLGLRRYSTVELLVALGLLFVFLPFVDEMKGGDLVTSILVSLVLLSAVLAVGRRGRSLIFPALLAFVAIAGRWISYFRPDLLSPAAFIPGLILMTYVVSREFRAGRAMRLYGFWTCGSMSLRRDMLLLVQGSCALVMSFSFF